MNSTFLTPVGRIVSGNIWKANTTDYYNKPCDPYWFFKLAIPKTDPKWPELEAQIHQIAIAGHPACFPGGVLNRPDFAMKIEDGDSTVPNKKGVANCTKEGHPGHWILSFRTQLKTPEVFENGGTVPILESSGRVKCGDWIEVWGNCSANNNMENPGVYLNPDLIGFVAYGQPISYGPDASVVLAGQRALPAGASATPLSASVTPATPATANPYTPPVTTPPVAASVPAAQVQPVPSFVAGPPATLPNMATASAPSQTPQYPGKIPPPASAPPPAPAPAVGVPGPPAPAVQPMRIYGGTPCTYDALIAAGHTPEAIATYPVAP